MKLLRYIELKSGHNDNGPAWIGYVTPSKTGRDPVLQWPSFDEVEGAAENLAVITLMLPRRCFLELHRRLHLGISQQAEIRWVVADGRLVPRRNAKTFGRRKTKT